MSALFGGDVKWEDMKVWSGKTRPLCAFLSFSLYSDFFIGCMPLARPKQTCPLTGLPASYLDPRTNVPYANVRAYETLTKILQHEYVWSEQLGCYVGQEGERRAMGIEGSGRESDVERKEKIIEAEGMEKPSGLEADAMDVS
jgi:vacuolar protein sorting-associated protein 72